MTFSALGARLVLTAAAVVLAADALGAQARARTRPSPADVGRLARLLAQADARQLDAGFVDSALASRRGPLRAATALVIGQTGARALAPRLRPLLGDPDTAVAANAAFALGLLRDTASVAALADAVGRRGAPTVALEAAWSLGEIGEPARAAIVAALGASAASRRPGVWRALLQSASRLRPVPVPAVVPLLASRDSLVREAAAYAIARPRALAGLRPLLALADAADAATRMHVARAAARPAVGDSLGELAASTLRLLVRDPHPHVRIHALRSLATHGITMADLVLAGTNDPDAQVRIEAAQHLGRVLPAEVAAWAPTWAADTGFMYRRSVLASAVRAGVALPGREEWLVSAEWRQRASVAEAAGTAPDFAGLRAVLGGLAEDRDPRVRAAAVGTLAAWADSSGAPDARRLLLAAARDVDAGVRSSALAALRARPRPEELATLVAAHVALAVDSTSDARVDALAFLAATWKRDSAAFDSTARRRLASLPAPADRRTRTAGRALPLLAWPDTMPAPRGIAWYEELVRRYVLPSGARRETRAELVTERGTVTIALHGADAPLTVHNFVTLARAGTFRDTRFHRVLPAFVAQGGDPRGDGSGGPGYAIRDELNRHRYERGAVGMALSGPDTGGSQFFLTLAPQPHLDGHYTVFGRVVTGRGAMDALVQGDRLLEVRVLP